MVNNSSIDWLFPWPDQALLAVATELITPDNPMIPRDYRQQIIEHVVDVHKSVIEVSRDFVTTLRRQNYVTPRNFLDFIATYQVPADSSGCLSLLIQRNDVPYLTLPSGWVQSTPGLRPQYGPNAQPRHTSWSNKSLRGFCKPQDTDPLDIV